MITEESLAKLITKRALALVGGHVARIEEQALAGEVLFVWLDEPDAERRVILLEAGYAAETARALGRTEEELARVARQEPGVRWVLALEGERSVLFRLRKHARTVAAVTKEVRT